MARARSPDSIEAEKLYKEGMLLVDIAKKIGKPEGTVRRWKSTQNWDGVDKKSTKNESERSGKKKTNVRKARGAPKGNKNSVGHAPSVPVGNENALKHGGYSSIYWDTLDEEEKEMLESMKLDEEAQLQEQITLFSIRERRIMKAINKYRDMKSGVYINNVVKRERKRRFADKDEEELYKERIFDKVSSGDRLPGESFDIQTMTSSTVDLVARLERELTSVQRAKTKALESLAKIRNEKAKEQRAADLHALEKELLDARIEQIDAQTNKILGSDVELEDTSDVDEILYGTGGGENEN